MTFKRIGITVLSIVVGAALFEGVLRATSYQYSPIKIGTNVAGDFREQHAFHDRHLVYDPDLIWRPLSGQFSPFNPQGFRGPLVVQPKPPGTLRVIALGDSNTFGWDVDEGVNWPTQLGNVLSASHAGSEVINGGVWGYTSFQGLRRFKEVLEFTPDVVLISYGANDAHQVHISDAEYVRRHDSIEQVTRATRRLRLAQLAVAALDRIGLSAGATGPLGPRVSLDDFSAHIREVILLARERSVRIVLLTRPFVGSATDPASWKTHAPAYNHATIEIGRAEQVPVIDIYAAFHERKELFDDESHFGVEGHRVAAELIHRELSALIPQR